jgi:hypothetical protein
MRQRVVLAPDVILDPVSFSLNLISFGGQEKIGIPLAWLWEGIIIRIVDRWGLISTADTLAYYSAHDLPYDESIWFNWDDIKAGWINDFDKFGKSVAILRTAYELGIVEGFITQRDKEFFEKIDPLGGWHSWLLEIMPKYSVIPFDETMIDLVISRASQSVCLKHQIGPDRLHDIVSKNRNWSTRSATEYPIYEEYRRLNVEIGEIFSACCNGYFISTSSDDVRKAICTRLKDDLRPVDFHNEESLPLIEVVKMDPHQFTVKDVMDMVTNRTLMDKLGKIQLVMRKQAETREKLSRAKDLIVYVLGWIPLLDLPLKLFEGTELLLDKIRARRQSDENSCVYFNVERWKKDYQKMGPDK